MSKKMNSSRDAFGFSLLGLRSIAAYAPFMAVGDDGINAAWDEKLRCALDVPPSEGPGNGPLNGRFWLSRRYRSA